ncbi:MAG: hypothetical protein IJ408_00815 [Clostridia bacterium]|nr:hypothetical protein [Clostridia bacterium]
MKTDHVKIIGLALTCFSLGTIIQIFIPNIFIVILFACVMLLVGILLIRC